MTNKHIINKQHYEKENQLSDDDEDVSVAENREDLRSIAVTLMQWRTSGGPGGAADPE